MGLQREWRLGHRGAAPCSAEKGGRCRAWELLSAEEVVAQGAGMSRGPWGQFPR